MMVDINFNPQFQPIMTQGLANSLHQWQLTSRRHLRLRGPSRLTQPDPGPPGPRNVALAPSRGALLRFPNGGTRGPRSRRPRGSAVMVGEEWLAKHEIEVVGIINH